MLNENGYWGRSFDEVIAKFHTTACPNKKVITLGINEVVDDFWKDFKKFTNHSVPYSYQSG